MPISSDLFKEPKEYLIGVVSDIREDEGRFGPQIVFELTPLGEMTPRLKWYNAQTAHSRRSGWQRLLKALRALSIDTSDPNNIVGKIVKIQLVENTFTNDDGEDRTFDVWKPIKVYGSESDALEDLAASDTNVGGPPIPAMGPAPTSTSTIPTDVLTEAKKVWSADGMTEATFRMVAPTSYPGVDVEELVKAVKS